MKYNYYQSDSHLQEYSYDEDNRLTKVRTSRYGYLWDQDATYQYYPHGPLRRISLGHDILQGIDYSYTIQGWLKAINHVEITNNAGTTKDPGRDGIQATTTSPTTAYDGFSEILNYFNGDYVHQVTTFSANRLNTQSNFAPLYNGNIASIENNYKLGSNNSINFANQLDFTYKYDYINRLKEANTMFRTNNSSPGNWNPVKVPPVPADAYNSGYTYDPNGNIKTLGRKRISNSNPANADLFDALNYNYNTNSNQLNYISDNGVSTYSDDIKDQDPSTFNYNYDASGNQITDVAISNIQWTVDGKVKAVNGTASQLAKYVYDASGNRVMKQTPAMNTIYARDANSQVMAIYETAHFDLSVDTDPSVTPCIDIEIKEGDYGSNCTMHYTLCGSDYSYDVNTGTVTILATITSTDLCFGVHKYLQPQTKIILNPISLAIDGIQTTTGDMPFVNASLSQHANVSDITKMPKLSEWHIYGNEQQGRFSVKKPDYDPATDPLYYLDVLKSDVTKKNFFRILDKKQYELKDHLANVRVAIGDMKIPTAVRGVAPFVVDEKSVSDFYPGGMSISDRSWQGTSYRYGYNAQEKSLEIDASGNHQTAEFWEVNNASLRRWNRDPKPNVSISQYSIFGNNPILYNDFLGDSVYYSSKEAFDNASEGHKSAYIVYKPFVLNKSTNAMELDPNFNLKEANLNQSQLESFNNTLAVVNSSRNVLVTEVGYKEKFLHYENGKKYYQSLSDYQNGKGASGTTINYEEKMGGLYLGKYSFLIYVCNDLEENMKEGFTSGTHIGLVHKHEISHSFYDIFYLDMKQNEINRNVERIENGLRLNYRIYHYEYSWIERLFFGKYEILGGKASIHPDVKKNEK